MPQASKKRIMRCSAGLCLALALLLPAAGCGGSTTTTPTVTISPTSVTALVESFVQFTAVPSSTVDSVTYQVNGVTGGNSTVGTITTTGLYQAPVIVPASTTITITVIAADSADGTSAMATAAVTLDSGVRLSFVPATFSMGTGEQFTFGAKLKLAGVPPSASIPGVCDPIVGPPCTAVTWTAGTGVIDSNGLYTASASTGSDTVTATSIYDTTRTATATISIITAVDPTVNSLNTDVGAVGATQQDVYLGGANFLSTTLVHANGKLVADTDVVSSSLLHVRLATSNLITAGPLVFTVAAQNGTDQSCPSPCQLTLSTQRPAVVGSVPDSFAQNTSPTLFVDGGYFGTSANPTVITQFGGQPTAAIVDSANQLEVTLSGSNTATPGLVPVNISSNISGSTAAPTVVNVAVQPAFSTVLVPSSTLPVGTLPSAVAINTATGIAVVANQGSAAPGADGGSVALINLAGPSVIGYICTDSAGRTLSISEPACPLSAPTSVAVDNMRNLALVTNSALNTVAVINLATGSVRETVPVGFVNSPSVAWAVGVNSLTGRAIVAYHLAGAASLLDLNQVPAAVIGVVSVSTGATPRVAVSSRLNWALATPGGAGSLGIVDLGRQNTNAIASATQTSGVVTITTAASHTLRPGDAVLISGIADPTFNGIFNVAGVSNNTFTYSATTTTASSSGGTANYALPIATVATSLSVSGVAINDETQKAILVDPISTIPVQIFNFLDQTSTAVPGYVTTGNNNDFAGAFNPFTNVAVTVNKSSSTGTVIDPATPATLSNGTFSGLNVPVDVAIDPATNTAVIANRGGNSVTTVQMGTIRSPQVLQVSRQDNGAGAFLPPEITVRSSLSAAPTANPQTLTIIGGGFTNSSVAQLDGTNLATTFVSARSLTAVVPAAMLTAGPRIYSFQVVNGGSASNATSFTVSQSVDVTSAGCSTPAPASVAIDYSSRNQAVVSNPGCNNVAIINLTNGTGTTVAVGNNPQGVAMFIQSPQTGLPSLALVANANDNTVSVVDTVGNTVINTVNTDPTPIGVAIDPGLAMAVVTASNANVVDLFPIPSTPGTGTATTPLPVQTRPQAVAVDPITHFAAVANSTGNSISLVDLNQVVATLQIPASGFPSGIALDPVNDDYLALASLANNLLVLDPINQNTTTFRVGINPTSIAYNSNSSTLVTTNSISQTMSVMDYASKRVRAVFSFKASGRFSVDINPLSNLAVIADPVDNVVILRPLPR